MGPPTNFIDDSPNFYPLLYALHGDMEANGYDLPALYGGPARLISVGTAGDLVVCGWTEDGVFVEEVIYSAEWSAMPLQRITVHKVLEVTTDETKYPVAVHTTADYVRIYV